jgi:hypothetical protein
MDKMSYMEISQQISCGELACLQQCTCNDPRGEVLQSLHALFTGLTAADLPLLHKMLCGCATTAQPTQPEPNDQGGTNQARQCVDTLKKWALENRSTFNVMQSALTLLASSGVPWLSQIAGAGIIAMEGLEDLATTPGDTNEVGDVLNTTCNALKWVDEFQESVVDKLPDVFKPAFRATFLPGVKEAAQWCCGGTITPSLPQPPSGGQQPTPPQLPPSPPTTTGGGSGTGTSGGTPVPTPDIPISYPVPPNNSTPPNPVMAASGCGQGINKTTPIV